jgi:hypothetical protein
MRRFAILCVLALAGCAKEPSSEVMVTTADDSKEPSSNVTVAIPVESTEPSSRVTVTTPDNSDVKPRLFSDYGTQPDCEKAGGAWRAWCAPATESCIMSWPDAGKACSDSSECASNTCMVDTTTHCDENKQCIEPVIPLTGTIAVGVCKGMDVSCGSYIEIKKGIVQEQYDID